jgi:hypothetical protein
MRNFNFLGKTWEGNTLNQRTIKTIEMRNVLDVVALNFDDLGEIAMCKKIL